MDVYVELKATIADYLAKMGAARREMDSTSRSADNLAVKAQSSGSGLSLLTKSALAVAPALAPIGTVVAGLGVGLAGIGIAAVGGLGAFALAAVPVITNITNASKAQDKYTQAVATYGPASAQAKTAQLQMNAALGAMSPQARNAATQLTAAKTAYQQWAASLAPQIIPVFTQALSMLKPLLADLTPIVKTVAGALQEVGGQFQILLAASQPFFSVLATVAGTVVRSLGDSLAQLAAGIMDAFTAAAPLITTVAGLLFQLSVAFSSLDFQAILGPLTANFAVLAPIVGTFAKQLIVIVGGLLKAVAPIGVALFQVIAVAVTAIMPVVTTLGKVIGAIAPVVSAVAQALAGVLGAAIKGLAPIIQALLPIITEVVKLLGGGLIDLFKVLAPAIAAALPVLGQFISAVVAALGPAIKNLAPLLSDLTPLTFVFVPILNGIVQLVPLFGQLAGVAAGLIGPLGQIVGIFLSAGGAVLGTLVPALIGLAGTLIKDLVPVIAQLIPILPQIAQLMGVALAGAVQILLPLIQGLTPILNVLIPLLAAVLIPTLNFLVAALKMVPGPILAVAAALLIFDVNPIILGVSLLIVGIVELAKHWGQIWADIKRWTDDAIKFLRGGFGTLILAMQGPIGWALLIALHWQGMWRDIKAWTLDGVNAVVGFFVRMGVDVKHWTLDAVNTVKGFFLSMWQTTDGYARNMWRDVTGFFAAIWRDALASVKGLAHDLATWFTGIVFGIATIMGRLPGQLLQVGKDMISEMVKGIVHAIPSVLGAVGSVVHAILDKFHLGFLASPSSHVMQDVGRSLMQGLADGINKHLHKATGAAAFAAGSVVSTMTDSTSSIGMGIPGAAAGGWAAVGKAMAAQYGWTGAEWNALNAVAMRESGWNPNAQNPTSSAYGIAQNIGGRAGYPDPSPAGQIAWMLAYIKGRYGDPINAWAHEMSAGWYDQGGLLPPGLSLALNTTGHAEVVRPGGGGGGPITIILQVDGKTLGRVVLDSLLQEQQRRPLGIKAS